MVKFIRDSRGESLVHYIPRVGTGGFFLLKYLSKEL
jgi:hypothetical protein